MSLSDDGWRQQVSALIALMEGSDLTELDIVHGSFALRLERDSQLLVAAPAVTAAPAPQDVEAAAESILLRSPQVGTFYVSAEPHGEPFVHPGSHVEPGQVIGLIEAMKLITEVEAESGGTVRRALVDDGQAVEYGQPLFELE
jgi:acetyl-CoA carboxylase biotin carboxyl carrier protein